jgi:hypothetical protein
MIAAIKTGKDVGTIQSYWEEIKEGIKTSGSVMTIAATIGKFLGLI